jgi:hypothetical protein
MSQFGIFWLFMAAPLVGIVVDLARYGYGRLGDPPAPAGVIPGSRVTPIPPTAPTPIPSAYQTIASKESVSRA